MTPCDDLFYVGDLILLFVLYDEGADGIYGTHWRSIRRENIFTRSQEASNHKRRVINNIILLYT